MSDKESCPNCIIRPNSLAVIYPDTAKLWSPNNEHPSDRVLPDTSSWAKWICPNCNGEYRALISKMTSGEATCPYCNDRLVLADFNSLGHLYPNIAKIWSHSNDKTPFQVLSGVSTLAKWECPDCGGEYSSSINDMVLGKYSCPYCNDRSVLPGFNSFAANHPDLLNEWDYVNNYLLADPDQISDSFNLSIWWICPKDKSHEYPMSPARKLMYHKRHKESCPYCKGLRRKKRHFV